MSADINPRLFAKTVISRMFKKAPDKKSALAILKNELQADKYSLKTLISREMTKDFRSELINLIDSEHMLHEVEEGNINIDSTYNSISEFTRYLHKLNNYKIIENDNYTELCLVNPEKCEEDMSVYSKVLVYAKAKYLLADKGEEEKYPVKEKLGKEQAYKRLYKEIETKEDIVKKMFSNRAKEKSNIMQIIDADDPTIFDVKFIREAYDEIDDLGSYIFCLQICSNIDDIYTKKEIVIDEKNRLDIREIPKNNGMYT